MGIDPVQAARHGTSASPAEVPSHHPADPTTAAPVSSAANTNDLPTARQLEVNASFGQNHLIIYRIVDRETGELIQQIPPEQLLQIARSVQELLQARPDSVSLDVRS